MPDRFPSRRSRRSGSRPRFAMTAAGSRFQTLALRWAVWQLWISIMLAPCLKVWRRRLVDHEHVLALGAPPNGGWDVNRSRTSPDGLHGRRRNGEPFRLIGSRHVRTFVSPSFQARRARERLDEALERCRRRDQRAVLRVTPSRRRRGLPAMERDARGRHPAALLVPRDVVQSVLAYFVGRDVVVSAYPRRSAARKVDGCSRSAIRRATPRCIDLRTGCASRTWRWSAFTAS